MLSSNRVIQTEKAYYPDKIISIYGLGGLGINESAAVKQVTAWTLRFSGGGDAGQAHRGQERSGWPLDGCATARRHLSHRVLWL